MLSSLSIKDMGVKIELKKSKDPNKLSENEAVSSHLDGSKSMQLQNYI